MKKLDLLLIRSFIPPMVVWFLVALFIFNMQFLWKYIDEIVGKGLSIFLILELLFYQALAMVPKALVFGVLIASVMSLGNLAEHYELTSMKSAGISLSRTMRPLLFICILLGFGSYAFADYFIPNAALQFKGRLHDIRRTKPALVLEKGQFNYDFKGIVIYIGDKDADSRHLYDIKLYDHSRELGNVNQTNARHGELFYSDDKRYLILRLYDGVRFEELTPPSDRPMSAPFTRVEFKEFTAMFDMKQFEQKETDRDLFKDHYSLLNTRQLSKAIDSLFKKVDGKSFELQRNTHSFFHFQRVKTDTSAAGRYIPSDSLLKIIQLKEAKLPATFLETIDLNKRKEMAKRAFGSATQIRNQAETTIKSTTSVRSSIAEHENEIHQKIVYALACLIFLYVGAPMGALIRKGGFGWPVLVSFLLFMIFFVANLMGERLAKNLTLPCWMGSWLPIWVILPLAVWLTRNAVRDTEAISSERFKSIGGAIAGFFRKFQRKKAS